MRRWIRCGILIVSLTCLTSMVWSQIVNTQISLPHYQLQNEEQVCYCPTDQNILIAVWRDFRTGNRRCAIGRSTDGGLTWSDQLNSNLLWDRQTDPAMTVDRDGNFY